MNNPSQNQSSFDRKNVENIYPLSPMQQGLMFHTLLSPTAGAYVPQIVLTLQGTLDSNAMQQAWQHALQRHGTLRSGFFWEQRDEPFQILFRQLPLHWVEQDWRALSPSTQKVRLDNLLTCNRVEPFKLQRPPLMRLFWLQLSDDRVQLIWCYHHLILDGWSSALVLQDVLRLYCANVQGLRDINVLPPSPRPYSDYIQWLKRQNQEASLAYWQDILRDSPTLPRLPGQHPLRQGQTTPKPQHLEISLDEMASERIQLFLRRHHLTLNSLLQGTLGLLLRRYGNDGDILFGTTVAGRPASLDQSTEMVGLFINSIPVRLSPSPDITIGSWLQQIQSRHQQSSEHDYVSLREIQSRCNQGHALFNLLLVLESYPAGREPGNDMLDGQAPIRLEQIQFDESTHLPLTLQVAPGPRLQLGARFDLHQFQASSVERLLNHFKTLLLAIIEQPDATLKDIRLLSRNEIQQRQYWNDTIAAWPSTQTLPDLVEAQANAYPDHTALVFENTTMSYRELNQRANQLAHYLQKNAIGAESIIAVHMERSLELLIALLAIQKTGAAWLPLDCHQPVQRLKDMVEDAKPAALIFDSTAAHLTEARTALDTNAWQLDINDTALALQPQDNPSRTLQTDNAAYLLYTSGSTGKPKGVINTQAGIVNRLHWMKNWLNLQPQNRVLHKTPLSFDVSVWELFLPLISAATLVIALPQGHLDRHYLLQLMRTQRINVLHFVPALLADFLDQDTLKNNSGDLPELKHVVCSGEALTPTLQERFFTQIPHTQLHNLYGPTEAAIDVTAWQCHSTDHQERIPIGKPIANCRIHLLDGDGHEVPVGAIGHLHIGGIGVARGYLNRAELNIARFLPDRFCPDGASGNQLYDSGDLACYREDGVVDYVGRGDDQIKLRGVRMELGEIESKLSALSGVHQAVVRVWPTPEGDMQLVGYVVPSSNTMTDDWAQQRLKELRQQLPESMVPSCLIMLNDLPLNSSGKPDRKQLPPPHTETIGEPPHTDSEKLIADIWQQALKLEQKPHRNAHFFHLGGHSLIATRIVNRIREATGIELPLPSVFEHATLSALAQALDQLRCEEANQKLESASATAYREITI